MLDNERISLNGLDTSARVHCGLNTDFTVPEALLGHYPRQIGGCGEYEKSQSSNGASFRQISAVGIL